MPVFFSSIFLILFRPALALETPCYLEAGDGDHPAIIEHSILFRGPSNQFWSYVNQDPSTWSFEVVSSPKAKRVKPQIERFSIRLPDGSFVQMQGEIKFTSETRFTFEEKKIDEFVLKMKTGLQKLLQERKIAYPPLSKQTLEIIVEFQSDGSYSENWLSHSCRIGFGLNQLRGQLSAKVGDVGEKELNIKVNNPPLDTSAKDQISLKTDSKGAFELKGLPLGTFIVDLPTPNKVLPIAYMDDLPKTCNLSILREKSDDKGWTVTQSSCSTVHRGR